MLPSDRRGHKQQVAQTQSGVQASQHNPVKKVVPGNRTPSPKVGRKSPNPQGHSKISRQSPKTVHHAKGALVSGGAATVRTKSVASSKDGNLRVSDDVFQSVNSGWNNISLKDDSELGVDVDSPNTAKDRELLAQVVLKQKEEYEHQRAMEAASKASDTTDNEPYMQTDSKVNQVESSIQNTDSSDAVSSMQSMLLGLSTSSNDLAELVNAMKLNFETIVKSGNDKAVNELLSYFTSFRDLSSQPSVENDDTSVGSSKASSKQRRCKSGSESMLSSKMKKALVHEPDYHFQVEDPEIAKIQQLSSLSHSQSQSQSLSQSQQQPAVITKTVKDNIKSNLGSRAGATEPTSKMLSRVTESTQPFDTEEDSSCFELPSEAFSMPLTDSERQLESIFLAIPSSATYSTSKKVPMLNTNSIIRPKTTTSAPKLTEKAILRVTGSLQQTLVLSPRTAFDDRSVSSCNSGTAAKSTEQQQQRPWR